LTTRFVSLSNGRFGHPVQDRAITLREGALLQTFPPDYRFVGRSRDACVAQVGNAVPPLLARRIFEAIIDHARS
jgi:DNA (cytosine-5)-methyltransferase 1